MRRGAENDEVGESRRYKRDSSLEKVPSAVNEGARMMVLRCRWCFSIVYRSERESRVYTRAREKDACAEAEEGDKQWER